MDCTIKQIPEEPQKIYLDYNATTPLDPSVLTTIHHTLQNAWGNPSSLHAPGIRAKELIIEARKHVADMLGSIPSDIIFTSGGTEGNNWIIDSAIKYFEFKMAEKSLQSKKLLPHFVTTNLEHDSVKLVFEHLEHLGVAELTVVQARKTSGRVEKEDILLALRPNTALVSIMLANNETGVIQPVASTFTAIKGLDRSPNESRILLHTDAAQVIGKMHVNVDDLSTDYLTIVGHKFYGPRIGAIYVRNLEMDKTLFPMLIGGGQERNYRPGTENTGMIAGLGRAAQLIVENVLVYETHMRKVRDYLEAALQKEFGSIVHFNGKCSCSSRLPNTCNFSLDLEGLEGYKMLATAQHIQASVGSACHTQNQASPILLSIGIPVNIARNALRFSVGRETSCYDIDLVIKDLKQCVDKLMRPP